MAILRKLVTSLLVILVITPMTYSDDDTNARSALERNRQPETRSHDAERDQEDVTLRSTERNVDEAVRASSHQPDGHLGNSPKFHDNVDSFDGNGSHGNRTTVDVSQHAVTSSQTETTTVPSDNATSATGLAEPSTKSQITAEQWHIRMRAKNTRIFMIQSKLQILRGLGRRQHHRNQPTSARRVTQSTNTDDAATVRVYVQRRNQNYSSNGDLSAYAKSMLIYNIVNPSCDVPPRTHRVWHESEDFRLYFPLDGNRAYQSRIEAARLRLYKKAPEDCGCLAHGGDDDDDDDADDEDDEGTDDPVDEKALRRTKRLLRKEKRHKKVTRSVKRSKKRRQRLRSQRGHDPEMVEDEVEDMLKVTVFWFKKPVKRNPKPKKQLAASMVVPVSRVGWVEIDIKTPVQRWSKRPNKNFGLEIRVEDSEQRELDPHHIFAGMDCSNQARDTYASLSALHGDELLNETLYTNMTFPTLEIAEVDISDLASREKRHTSQTCVLEKHFVTFEDMGFDWIIAPRGMDIGYCHGHCLSLHAQRHDTEYMEAHKDSYKGCCGPMQLKPFTFLYISANNSIMLSSIQDLVIAECGCRD